MKTVIAETYKKIRNGGEARCIISIQETYTVRIEYRCRECDLVIVKSDNTLAGAVKIAQDAVMKNNVKSVQEHFPDDLLLFVSSDAAAIAARDETKN